MKNISLKSIALGLLLLLGISLMTSCKEEDEIPQNTAKINGVQCVMNNAYLLSTGKNIVLVIADAKRGEPAKHLIQIQLHSTELNEGTYELTRAVVEDPLPNSFAAAYHKADGSIHDIRTGEVTIIKLSDKYVIDYQLSYDKGEIKGHYGGSIMRINPE